MPEDNALNQLFTPIEGINYQVAGKQNSVLYSWKNGETTEHSLGLRKGEMGRTYVLSCSVGSHFFSFSHGFKIPYLNYHSNRASLMLF